MVQPSINDDTEMLNTSAIQDDDKPSEDVSMIDTTTLNIKRAPSSMIQLTPVKSLSQKTVEEGGVIAETFYGKLLSFIHYKNPQGEDKF